MDFIIRKFAPNFDHLMLLDRRQNSWMISGSGGGSGGRPSEISPAAVITAKLFPNFANSLIRQQDNSPEQQESEVQVNIGCKWQEEQEEE